MTWRWWDRNPHRQQQMLVCPNGFRSLVATHCMGVRVPPLTQNMLMSYNGYYIAFVTQICGFDSLHQLKILSCSLMGKRYLDMVKRVGSLPTRTTKYASVAKRLKRTGFRNQHPRGKRCGFKSHPEY
jgi:hypothetical protein